MWCKLNTHVIYNVRYNIGIRHQTCLQVYEEATKGINMSNYELITHRAIRLAVCSMLCSTAVSPPENESCYEC
jgi:hypothetical protein